MNTATVLLMVSAVTGPADRPHSTSQPEEIVVERALVTLIDHAEVPAREAGVLAEMGVQEGRPVKAGQLLGRIDDTEARLALQKAETELKIAAEEAANDVKVQTARKTREVAESELQRALDLEQRYPNGVSASEIDRLRLTAERAALEVRQAEFERRAAELAYRRARDEAELAARSVERRRIVSPINGVVVLVRKQLGEWVQPGDAVYRVLRIDRLRAEGFLDVRGVQGRLEGCPVTLTVDLPGRPAAEFTGKLVFASPEINPVNGEIRVWAEFDNPELELKPGLPGTLTIHMAP